MYCSACKLQYLGNLHFCKQCGRPLVDQPEDPALTSKCCTRCGARAISGENFCQQCGARVHVKSEDTTIGACQQCLTPWRSAWLYCRNCGLDRDSALSLVSVPAIPDQSVPTVSIEVVSISSQAADSKSHCPRCVADVMPYAQFCDNCGQSLTSGVEPFPVEEDEEVHHKTLEVEIPEVLSATNKVNEQEIDEESQELDPSRTTERVLILKNQPAEAPAAITPEHTPEHTPEPYVTRESEPVLITELYRGDESTSFVPEHDLEAQTSDVQLDDLNEATRTTSFESRRSTAQVSGPHGRLTAESKGVSTGQIENEANDFADVEEYQDDYFIEDGAAPPARVTARTPVNRSRRAAWQALAIVVCLLVLLGLLALIIWQEMSRRSAPSQSQTGATPLPSTAQTGASASSTSRAGVPEGMVLIPGGTMRMGRYGGDKFERPVHTVTVGRFFLDRTEVTNEQYQKFVSAKRHPAPPHWTDGQFPSGEGKFPVVNVSWNDASAYATWAGKRLPSEAEWEFAARGAEGRLYPWGSKWLPGRANTSEGGPGQVVAVGSFPQGASQFGVLDLSGNVWEWTVNELTSYAGDNIVLAPGRVIRGGAWDVPRDRATATYRGVVQQERRYDKTGFRCAK